MQNEPIDTNWLTDTLTDAQETLDKAIGLLESDPRHAQGVLEHEIPALYAKLNYAVNTSYIGPNAVNILAHERLTAWPQGQAFKAFAVKEPVKKAKTTKSRARTAKQCCSAA